MRTELLAYPGVPSRWSTPDAPVAPPLLTLRLARDEIRLAFFSTITTLANALDTTLERLRIECFYPADAATEDAMAARST